MSGESVDHSGCGALGPSGARDEDPLVRARIGEEGDHLERLRISPVQIFQHEDTPIAAPAEDLVSGTWEAEIDVQGQMQIKVTLERSIYGQLDNIVKSVRGLGLRRMRHVVERADTAENRGMAKKVPLEAPWTAPEAEAWDGETLHTWMTRNLPSKKAYELFRIGLETVFAADPRGGTQRVRHHLPGPGRCHRCPSGRRAVA